MKRREQGVALLFVLMTIVVVSTATLGLVRVTLVERVRSSLDAETEIASEVARATETPILRWLVSRSRDVILPLEAEEPRVEVLNDAILGNDPLIEIRVTAWDTFGMLPLATIERGGPLADLLPNSIRRRREEIRGALAKPFGLDAFVDTAGQHESPFPDPSRDATRSRTSTKETALGALLAPSNAWPGELNVHTAPIAFVEAVLRAERRDGLSALLAQRARGERVTAMPSSSRANRKDREVPTLVNESTCFAFRIDVRVGLVRRSWWAVYEAASASEWVCAQRMGIP